MLDFARELHSIVEYVRPLRGGSQPFLAGASDGQLYVVKFNGNPQGPNVLLNECVGNELYRLTRPVSWSHRKNFFKAWILRLMVVACSRSARIR